MPSNVEMAEESLKIVNRQFTARWNNAGFGPATKVRMPVLEIHRLAANDDQYHLRDNLTHKTLTESPMRPAVLASVIIGMALANDTSRLHSLTKV